MPIIEWEGYMRDGMSLKLEDIKIFEGKKGQGMCLRLAQFLRSKNRRVIIDFDIARKYKHFDEKEFLKELEAEEVK